MKIAVLFGSFNPLTNAHVTAMKTAVSALSADKGLFVCTSDKYLKRKMIRLDDPFCLSEDERRGIIEAVCSEDDRLGFWGFELGGISPKRYKTLCKIQAQYPEAEIYEVQGADKLRSTFKIAEAEDYISNFRFAVFERDGIDLNTLIESTGILREHRENITILPAILGGEGVSSTEARRRFYAAEDYTDILPEPAVRLISGHKLSDFAISYAERIQTIMNSGRFGIHHAGTVVYSENTARFREWKAGKEEPTFGDYQTFLDGATLFDQEFRVDGMGETHPETKTGCINIDCVDLAEHLLAKGYNPAILNLASAGRPGGGYDRGMHAQEESLCQCSNLSLSLYQFADPKRLKCVRDSGVPIKKIGYPLDTNFGAVYTKDVTFFRNNSSGFYTEREKPFKCDVATVAALSFNGRSDFSRVCEMLYRSESGGFTPAGEAIMLNKIRTIFRLGILNGKDSMILGAFGCGAYKLPPAEVSRLFRVVMNEPEFAGKFRLIVFAILERGNRPTGTEGKFADFYREFGDYSL
jgi:nicotinate (nicotinamide) nucleotide adenylyltransferase